MTWSKLQQRCSNIGRWKYVFPSFRMCLGAIRYQLIAYWSPTDCPVELLPFCSLVTWDAGTEYCLTYPYLNLGHFQPAAPGRFNFDAAVYIIRQAQDNRQWPKIRQICWNFVFRIQIGFCFLLIFGSFGYLQWVRSAHETQNAIMILRFCLFIDPPSFYWKTSFDYLHILTYIAYCLLPIA